jgi:hypothetical protein
MIKTGITTKVQLKVANITIRTRVKRFVFEVFLDLSRRIEIAKAITIAPAVAVTNPSSKNVPKASEVKASNEAGASKKKTVFLVVLGKTTSQTAANAYPRIEISSAQVNA